MTAGFASTENPRTVKPATRAVRLRVVVTCVVLSSAIVAVGLDSRSLVRAPWVRGHAWDFRDDVTKSWTSPNAQVSRHAKGVTLTPAAEPALLSSGALALNTRRYASVRLRLIALEPTEGRLGLVIETPQGIHRSVLPFQVRGGSEVQTIAIPFPEHEAHGTVRAAMLVPSARLQPVTVVSLVFDPTPLEWIRAGFEDLFSSWPARANSGSNLNVLAPPSMWGRAIWIVLTPIAAWMAAAWLVVPESSLLPRLGGPWAFRGIALVWGVGLMFLIYHQIWALSIEVAAFGGTSRAEAYRLLDGAPLYEDLVEAARFIDPRAQVDFVVGSGDPPLWGVRAEHVLYPIVIRLGSPTILRYFGRSHPPCGEIEPSAMVVRDAERYCLLRTGG